MRRYKKLVYDNNFSDTKAEVTTESNEDSTFEEEEQDKYDYISSYANIHKLMCEVEERINDNDYDVAVQKMRSTAELMARYLYEHNIGKSNADFCTTINILGTKHILSQESVSNYHNIRMKGNLTSHGESVDKDTAMQLYSILKDETETFANNSINIKVTNVSSALFRYFLSLALGGYLIYISIRTISYLGVVALIPLVIGLFLCIYGIHNLIHL